MGLRKLPMESVEALVMKLGKQAALQLAQFKAESLPDVDYFGDQNADNSKASN